MTQPRSRFSLRFRSFAAAFLAIICFVPLAAITLEKAFSNSLSQSMRDQLHVQNLMLLSAFEFDQGEDQMPEFMTNDSLNVPGSGLYAFATSEGELLWRSLSALYWSEEMDFPVPVTGNELFAPIIIDDNPYFIYSYTAEYDNGIDFTPVSFYILQDKRQFDAEVSQFRKTLWQWLALIALILLALLLFSLVTALRPISQLIRQISYIEQGKQGRIQGDYPMELDRLKQSLNQLLDMEHRQRQSYKNSLGDLAHSLKTPLSVLKGLPELPEHSREPINQINSIIQRQLKRASAGAGSGWYAPQPLLPLLQKLQSTMNKIYLDKSLSITIECIPDVNFHTDTTDMMELLGNLLDNACKAANHKVRINASEQKEWLLISIEDDGPGIAPEHRQALLQRGARLDSYTDGQGIGMALVADLIAAYQGRLDIEDSVLGGASVKIKLPASHMLIMP